VGWFTLFRVVAGVRYVERITEQESLNEAATFSFALLKRYVERITEQESLPQ